MAYYAALVSTVELLKEMSLSEHHFPKSLFQKQQIPALYETLSHLQELLEDYSPNYEEAASFWDRIRDAACLAQDLIECQIPDAACGARENIETHLSDLAWRERDIFGYPFPFEDFRLQEFIDAFEIPDAIYEAELIIFEFEFSDGIPGSNCLEEITKIAFRHFVSASNSSEHVNKEEIVFTIRKGYHDLLELMRQLRFISRKGFRELKTLADEVDSVIMGKGFRELKTLADEVDSINMGKGYLDLVKEELVPIVLKGYQDLWKLKEELDIGGGKGYQDLKRVKEVVDSIVGRGNQDLDRLKEEIDVTVGKGYNYVLEKIKEVVDSIVRTGCEDIERMKEEVDFIVGRRYQHRKRLMEEVNFVDFAVFKGYQDLEMLVLELGAIAQMGNQNMEKVKVEVDSIVARGYQDLQRMKEEVDLMVEKGYKDIFEKVKEEVDSIVEDLTRIKKKSHTTHQDDLQVNAGASTQGPSDGTRMVGFEEHLKRIKEKLFGLSSNLEVISIVGMGGIGKTTLAKNIFDDELIDYQFHLRVWVTVSQSYNLRNILLAIANSIYISNLELYGVEDGVLRKHIYQHLFGKRFLIIMDDVWDLNIWDDVKLIFPNDKKNRSRIIITTRQSDVASLASASDFINQIPVLTHHQSWTLFCEKVHCPPELEDIGRLTVKNCGGLPLAIVVVAGLLSKVNTTRSDWEEVARGMSSAAVENDDHFSKILSLSYNYLPHHLKPCFLYFGGFPEDYEISVSKLVKLWVAEGFLKLIPSKSLEEVAEEYLEELVKRNLVLITKRRSNGKFKYCSIHDLLRDLCSERAYHEQFLLLPHKHSATGHMHRFFLHLDSSSNISMPKDDFIQVRSFLSFGYKPCHVSSDPSNFKPLRVLDAPHIDFNVSPNEVFEWLNLRYLVLLCNDSSKFHIPSSIFKLQHLQTLIVVSSYWQASVSLPSEIWKMPRLKHVMSDQVSLPPNLDVGRNVHDRVPSLGALQTLSTLVDFKFNRKMFQMMPSIKKLKLQFSRFEHGENAWEKFGIKYLFHLSQLETLAINIDKEEFDVMPFPESFSFSPSLKKLNLRGCMLPWENMTVVGSLPNLQVLNLRCQSFVGEEWKPEEEEFPKLKFLLMDSLTGLKNWRTGRKHFPCLEHLVIKYCHGLEGIPSEIGDLPYLRLIEVRSCNSSVKSSALTIQEEQSDVGNDVLQVHIR